MSQPGLEEKVARLPTDGALSADQKEITLSRAPFHTPVLSMTPSLYINSTLEW